MAFSSHRRNASAISLLAVMMLISCVQARPFTLPYLQGVETKGGGTNCAVCTILVTIVDNYAIVQNQTIDKAVEKVCDLFPEEVVDICDYLVSTYGEDVVKLLEQDYTPDDVCLEMNICTDSTCRLNPNAQRKFDGKPLPSFKAQNYDDAESPWDWIVEIINKLAQKHEPIEDIDGDLFSDVTTLRGSFWRGKDCNELSDGTYPGRIDSGDPSIDHNCNGIKGKNTQGKAWEEVLCGNSGPLGTIVLGDSAGAHFSIPASFMNASELNEDTFDGLVDLIFSEGDWPQRSAYTGYEPNTTNVPMIDSIYKHMVNRNKCNHRDYQNLGVNGCRSGAMADNVILSLARNQKKDHPTLVFFELVGNDVCHPEASLDILTTPEEFAANVNQSIWYLEEHLPPGSHVVFVGLANGGILYDTLFNRTHPLGVRYFEVYDYLNCLQISPCWGWMNSNQTIRDATTARSVELSAVYNQLIAELNTTIKNFDMYYIDWVEAFGEVDAQWRAKGGQTWELIEPVDGFHPNQIALSLLADNFWNRLVENRPNFIGQVNPNNAQIEQLFKTQGGY
eukprot:TRINITY_DN19938_c0_g1_i2.p1 TRINITY_DN19938_c0_g1~~TRINITY_DN19938_c0_g1_i2.p1  ORF type:complete len:562 (-),score=85.30 TRINITY_DN19938_c0_g1_i2:69-1754(-)